MPGFEAKRNVSLVPLYTGETLTKAAYTLFHKNVPE
jgi:hypothetical protein